MLFLLQMMKPYITLITSRTEIQSKKQGLLKLDPFQQSHFYCSFSEIIPFEILTFHLQSLLRR